MNDSAKILKVNRDHYISIVGFRNSLLDWYRKNRRDLPFRKSKDPYQIWISEVMLQQTRIEAMLGEYIHFIKKFPDIKTLSDAKMEDVLSAWKGLGYYSRAQNLKKSAEILCNQHNSRFPENFNEAMELPGIGEYTAAAVLSIAYGKQHPVIDGNVKRCLSRIVGIQSPLEAIAGKKMLKESAVQLLNPVFPGDHNQALMELGSQICIPKNPKCSICPVKKLCYASNTGKQSELPVSKKKGSKKNGVLIFVIISQKNKILLVRDKNRKFFKTIYSLPYLYIEEGKLIARSPEFLDSSIANLAGEHSLKHTITNHSLQIRVTAFHGKFSISEGADFRWIVLDELESEFPSSCAGKVRTLLLR